MNDTRQTPIDAALAYAAELDIMLRGDTTDAVEHALVFGVGDLLGGLGCEGFEHDLREHLDRIEQREFDENPGAWSAGRGGNDPDSYVDGWLEDRLRDEQEAAAETWLTKARTIVEQADEAFAMRESV